MSAINSTIALPLSTRITLAFLMAVLAFAIMLGNAIVILAFVVDKNLRHRSNYFFLNLAIADFFVVAESWKEEQGHCEPGFMSNWYVLAITSILEFLAPVFSVAYFNIYIYWSLWKRGQFKRWQSHSGLTSPASSSHSGHSLKCELSSRASLTEQKERAVSLRFKRQKRKSIFLFSIRTQNNNDINTSKTGSVSASDKLGFHRREHLELLRAKKLAKSLAILLGVFTICWAPYSLFTFVLSLYPPNRRPKTVVYDITFWLQWCNSLVNPFLYPLCHKRFRRAFSKILCTKKQPMLSHNRSVSS
uniref:Histamine receptor H4 n=1 Tax=Rousettus aegyptiacus TaxID=9407 RepID=A0A7J8DHG7_ROUAE|nr:histamine receptor H4 [Rousettus aegyptiacus]